MTFLFDNDVPDSTRYVIEELDHEVILLRNVVDRAAPDHEVLEYACENGLSGNINFA